MILKCAKKRYPNPEEAMAFARDYIEKGYTYGYGVYKCPSCSGYHLTTKRAMSQVYTITLASIGWSRYEKILRLIDKLCGVDPCEA